MTSAEQQSSVGNTPKEEIDNMAPGSTFHSQILEAIDLQLRHIASQVENTDTPGDLEDCREEQTDSETNSGSKDGEKSDITLPSYTEMCGDEESIIHIVEIADDLEPDVDNISSSSGTLPGCFGDCRMVAPRPVLTHYRYIGKQRPNFEEFENKARVVEQRYLPADDSAIDVETFVKRWLNESETSIWASNFLHDSDTRERCTNVSPRVSSSAIEISSKACSERKRKLVDCESKEDLRSKSDTDLLRPKQRAVKRRKVSCY